MPHTVSRTLDCRESLCPGPLVEVSKALRTLDLEGVLEVLATDPGFVPDIQAFSRSTGHPLLSVEPIPGGVRALIRRAH